MQIVDFQIYGLPVKILLLLFAEALKKFLESKLINFNSICMMYGLKERIERGANSIMIIPVLTTMDIKRSHNNSSRSLIISSPSSLLTQIYQHQFYTAHFNVTSSSWTKLRISKINDSDFPVVLLLSSNS